MLYLSLNEKKKQGGIRHNAHEHTETLTWNYSFDLDVDHFNMTCPKVFFNPFVTQQFDNNSYLLKHY